MFKNQIHLTELYEEQCQYLYPSGLNQFYNDIKIEEVSPIGGCLVNPVGAILNLQSGEVRFFCEKHKLHT